MVFVKWIIWHHDKNTKNVKFRNFWEFLRICVSRFPSGNTKINLRIWKIRILKSDKSEIKSEISGKIIFYPNKHVNLSWKTLSRPDSEGQLSSGVKWNMPRILSGMKISGVGQIRLNKNIQTHSKLTLFVLLEFNLLKMPIYFRIS